MRYLHSLSLIMNDSSRVLRRRSDIVYPVNKQLLVKDMHHSIPLGADVIYSYTGRLAQSRTPPPIPPPY